MDPIVMATSDDSAVASLAVSGLDLMGDKSALGEDLSPG